MKTQVFSFILKISAGIVVILAVWFMFTYFLIEIGVVIPSNYEETLLSENEEKLLNKDPIEIEDLSYGCRFGVFSKDLTYQYGNMDSKDITLSRGVIEKEKSNLNGNFSFSVLDRPNDICVIKYSIQPYLNINAGFIRYPNYDFVSYGAILLIYIIYIYILTSKLVKRWQKEFEKISKITHEIRQQNLDFDYESSNITEFKETTESLITMRDELKLALYNQWKIENNKNEEIAALAHDIKIPLTIIKGNTELLIEDNPEIAQTKHMENITQASKKMEAYITTLIHFVKADKISYDSKKYITCEEFAESIKCEIDKFALSYHSIIEFDISALKGSLLLDYFAVERAILNIVSNALEYRSGDSMVRCGIKSDNKWFYLSVYNAEEEFSEEVIKKGKELFYTSDKSRRSIHYGIGIPYTDKIVQAHYGEVILKNDEIKGALVIIKLPIKTEIQSSR